MQTMPGKLIGKRPPSVDAVSNLPAKTIVILWAGLL